MCCQEGPCESQVVPITSTDIKERIHQTYRMGYIKDVILPRVSQTAALLISDSIKNQASGWNHVQERRCYQWLLCNTRKEGCAGGGGGGGGCCARKF